MRRLLASLTVISALLLTTQNADARYLMEMGHYNLHPYVGGASVMAQFGNRNPIATPGRMADGGYVDGMNLYQYWAFAI